MEPVKELPQKAPYIELIKALEQGRAVLTEKDIEAIRSEAEQAAASHGEKVKSKSIWEAAIAFEYLDKKYEIDAMPLVYLEPGKDGKTDQKGILLLVNPEDEKSPYLAYGLKNNSPVNYHVAADFTYQNLWSNSRNEVKFNRMYDRYRQIQMLKSKGA